MNTKWKGSVSKICQCCGKEFYVSPYRAESAKYCSSQCYHKATIVDKKRICKNCGKEFLLTRSRPGQQFCSKECVCESRRKQPPKKTKNKKGYWILWMSDGSGKPEHIYIMENIIGRKLMPNECVHHIDGNRSNNDPDNLRLMDRGEHSRLHRQQEISQGKELFKRGN